MVSLHQITPGATVAPGLQSPFGHQLVESPLQGPLGESQVGIRKQFFYGRAGRSRRDDAVQLVELPGWNLKWHDLGFLWHGLLLLRQILY